MAKVAIHTLLVTIPYGFKHAPSYMHDAFYFTNTHDRIVNFHSKKAKNIVRVEVAVVSARY